MNFFLLLNLVQLELTTASESIQVPWSKKIKVGLIMKTNFNVVCKKCSLPSVALQVNLDLVFSLFLLTLSVLVFWLL